MKKVIVDKIASVAEHLDLNHDLRVETEIPCEEGVLVAVEILNNKATYNKLELTSGRMAQLKRGDVIVGALGHRKALFGYSGHLPEQLVPGDEIQVLNIGGVLGICDSVNANFGQPFNAKVLGTVLHFPHRGERVGVPARVGGEKLQLDVALNTQGIPVVALAGTCMDSGKTAAACAVISRLRHLGFKVAAFKSTGVALRRDILAMEDAGAYATAIFSDYGVVATTNANGPAVTKTMINQLAVGMDSPATVPDVIVFELGDGILGSYGVEAILKDDAIGDALSCLILCANDPVGATGGVDILATEFKLATDIVTGPATDNQVGRDIINERLNIQAINAITDAADLGDAVAAVLQLESS
jgi:hypothetical protein